MCAKGMASEGCSVFSVGHWHEDFRVCPVSYEPLSRTKGLFKSRSPLATERGQEAREPQC